VHYTGIEGEGYRSLEGERVSYEPIRGRKGEQARACARSSRYGPVLALIHPSAEKENSQKLVCRMTHGPARWPPYGRPETSRLLKVDHNVLHVRIKMRLDAWHSLRTPTPIRG
jgi:hypothetical protein